MTVFASNDELERDSLVSLMSLAASNPEASADVLGYLASSDFTEVRCCVAENVSTPAMVLDTLMHDKTSVRAALAQNPNAIQHVWSLASDSSPAVRLNLAENPNLPDHVYQFLAKDPDLRVARRARRTLRNLRVKDSPVVSLFRLLTKVS
jgi:hypothetical protein